MFISKNPFLRRWNRPAPSSWREFHPLESRIQLSRTLRNPGSSFVDWPEQQQNPAPARWTAWARAPFLGMVRGGPSVFMTSMACPCFMWLWSFVDFFERAPAGGPFPCYRFVWRGPLLCTHTCVHTCYCCFRRGPLLRVSLRNKKQENTYVDTTNNVIMIIIAMINTKIPGHRTGAPPPADALWSFHAIYIYIYIYI